MRIFAGKCYSSSRWGIQGWGGLLSNGREAVGKRFLRGAISLFARNGYRGDFGKVQGEVFSGVILGVYYWGVLDVARSLMRTRRKSYCQGCQLDQWNHICRADSFTIAPILMKRS